MYNVHVPYRFLWSVDGSFDRRRWPRTHTATAVGEEDGFPSEVSSLNGERFLLTMHWVAVIDANGGLCLRTEWNSLE
jgi:hypothetical protein